MALHLVDGQRLVATHECVRIAAGGVDHVQVIQRDIAPVAQRLVLRQGALARLTCACHHSRGHYAKALREARSGETRKVLSIHAVNDNHPRYE